MAKLENIHYHQQVIPVNPSQACSLHWDKANFQHVFGICLELQELYIKHEIFAAVTFSIFFYFELFVGGNLLRIFDI